MKRISMVLVALIGLTTLSAQLISVDNLAALMKDPKVVVVDARPAADYMKTHINGAINIDASTLSNATPVEGTLKPVNELASIFGKHGLTTSSKIVIYCKTGINAGRIYWILKYLGASDVSMLDGQMDAWFGARKPITKNPKKLAEATFTPALNAAIKADKAYVNSKLSTAVLIDTRKKEEFAAGKIGNAINIPSEDMLSGSKLKTAAELTKMFASVPKDKEVIVYCKTGVSASLTYFVMKSVLNYPKVRLYEGAWVDWSN